MQRIQPGFIGKIGDGLTVRRPGGRTLHDSGSIGDIAHRSKLRRHRQDLAVSFNRGPQAGGRDRRVIDLRRHILDAGPHFRQIGLYLDRHPMRLAAGGIEEMNLSQLIVNQGIALRGEAANIGTVVVQNFGDGLGGRVVAEDPDAAGPPREEINLPAAVNGEEVRRLFVRNLDRVQALQPGDPNRAGAPAAVVSPGHERRVVETEGRCQRRIGDVCTIGRDLPLISHGQRQACGFAALGGNGIKLGVPASGIARGAKQDPLPIRRPPDGDIGARMIGHAMRNTSGHRNGEYIGVAVVLPGEGDGTAVR